MAKDIWGKIAVWAFIIGVVIALIIGLWQAFNYFHQYSCSYETEDLKAQTTRARSHNTN